MDAHQNAVHDQDATREAMTMAAPRQFDTYSALRQAARRAIDDLPMQFAFNRAQLDEALERPGTTDPSELIRVPGGGIMRKDESHLLDETFERIGAEREQFLSTEAGLRDALRYELADHEYGYTGDPTDALDALGLEMSDPRLEGVLNEVCRTVRDSDE